MINDIATRGTFDSKTDTVSYAGGQARVFGSMEDAIAAGKLDRTQYQVGKTKDGRYIGVSSGDLKKMTDTSRGVQFTQKEKEEAELEVAKGNSNFGAALGQKAYKGDKIGLDDALNLMFKGMSSGDIQNMSDNDFTKKYGKPKSYYTSRASANFKKYGSLAPEATSQFNDLMDTSKHASDAGARGAALNSDDAAAALNTLANSLSNSPGNRQQIQDLLHEHPELAADLVSQGKDAGEKMAMLAGIDLGANGASKLVHAVESLRGTEKGRQLEKLGANVAASAAVSNQLRAGAMGADGKSVIAGKTTSDVSKEASDAILAQAQQLTTMYQQLIAMQEKLNTLVKGK